MWSTYLEDAARPVQYHSLTEYKCEVTVSDVEFRPEEVRDNLTVSVLSFVPTLDDDGKSITCRSENPNVTALHLETSWTLSVVYPPVVRLRLGSSLAAGDIKEGDDVYFECHVRANPPARKLSWLHDDGMIITKKGVERTHIRPLHPANAFSVYAPEGCSVSIAMTPKCPISRERGRPYHRGAHGDISFV
ncbi:Myelin-associated glycoprotein [Eumeta japonica]|uniref:Myelin-associated glycoprotein n=1 Tax=Eumeta variegata TaxID=151549 RepID=A0A4C1U2P2_EUMVA|nr:Myelin-associated glycoprotein [Eumeta japonica]